MQLDLVSTTMRYPVSIGLDPGEHTGFAVYDRVSRRFSELREISFETAVWEITEKYKAAIIVIELPNNKSVWHKPGAGGLAAIQRTAVNVGSVLREAELLKRSLQYFGKRKGCDYEIRTVHPQGKVDAARFERITGHSGRSNQHCRDAGLLCWGV
ncbi:MAG: hypothetical protein PHE17_05265 [Thiothrix sp.]|uniref:hypothetical protein n=1 Tax=Thiothrix sp. TaxID=1032 RepID=UPI002621B5FF|nr:hypothetical protein [Thiothrix sp.]MDD5392411.1 hypothetical protein [Thiothrix sp.]